MIHNERKLEGWVVKFVSLEEYFFHELSGLLCAFIATARKSACS